MRRLCKGLLWSLTLSALLIAPTSATTMKRMNLGDLVNRADKIFRGTVINFTAGEVELGGGTIPTTTYTIRVDEPFKGDFDLVKDVPMVELTMIGKLPPVQVGEYRLRSPLPEMPQFEIGSSYLLFSSTPSSAGLCSPIGLGQGAFSIFTADDKEMALNEYDNLGLFKGLQTLRADLPTSGPVPYSTLGDMIRADVAVGR